MARSMLEYASLLQRGELDKRVEQATGTQGGFVFHHDKLRSPGKRPHCQRSGISQPRISSEE